MIFNLYAYKEGISNKNFMIDTKVAEKLVIPAIFENTENKELKPGLVYIIEYDTEKQTTKILNSSTNLLMQDELEKNLQANLKILKNFNKQKTEMLKKQELLPPKELIITNLKWDLLITAMQEKENVLLIGPKGSGKTKTVHSLAKQLGYEFHKVNCGALSKPKQTLVGTVGAKDGNTFLLESKFLKAFKSEEPIIIYLDELSRISAQAANYLMTIVDNYQSYIYVEELGETIYKGKGVRFIASANFGFEYADTRTQDGAWLDRWIKIKLGYLTAEQDLEVILQEVPEAKNHLVTVKKLLRITNLCRENSEQLQGNVSLRQIIPIVKFLTKGFSLDDLLDEVFKNNFINGDLDESETFETLINSI